MKNIIFEKARDVGGGAEGGKFGFWPKYRPLKDLLTQNPAVIRSPEIHQSTRTSLRRRFIELLQW
jgi:hypothetical protein